MPIAWHKGVSAMPVCYLEPSELLELKDNMALRNDDKVWIAAEIARAIREHLHPHGWRKLVDVLKTWIPLGTAVTIFLAMLALAGAGWNYAFTRVEKETRFETQTGLTLGQIDKTLAGLQTSMALLQAQFANSQYSKLPTKQLTSHKEELQSIKATLAQAPKEAPNFWPISLQIIILLSQSMYQLETVGKQPLSEISNVVVRGFGRGGLVSGRNVLLKGTIEGWTFENSVVHFDPSIKLLNVQFKNCVFIFPAEPNPPKSLQEIGTALLASDLQTVKITAG